MGIFTRARVRTALPLALAGLILVTGVSVSAQAASLEHGVPTDTLTEPAGSPSSVTEPLAENRDDAATVDAPSDEASPDPATPDTEAPTPSAPPSDAPVPADEQPLASHDAPVAGAGSTVGDQVSAPRLIIPDPKIVPPTTVGVPIGSALTVHEGDLTIRTAGAVISNLDIRGFVRVEAPNVTIRNTIIRGRSTSGDAILLYAGLGTSVGLRVMDSEISPTYKTPRTNGVFGYGFTLTRVDIHHVIDAVHIFGDNVTVENSRLRDNLHYANDPYHSDGSHDDSIQIQIGRNIRIVNNTISGSYNAAVQITQDRGPVADVTITGNRIGGGGCTINVAEKGRGPIAGLRIADNVFGASRFNCNILVPPTTTVLGSIQNTVEGGGSLNVVRRAQ